MAKKKGSDEELAAGHDRSDDLRRRSISALSKASVYVLLDRAIQLVSLGITARLLLPAEIAVVAAGGAAVSLLGLVTTLGIPSFLIQVATLSPRIQAAARTILLVTAAICIGLVEVFAPVIAQWFNNPQVTDALHVMALILVAPVLSAPALARLSRDLRARDIARADLFGNSLGIFCVTLPLAFMDYGFWALAWGAVAQVLMRTTILCVVARQPLLFGLDPEAAVAVVRRSAGFMLNILLNRLEMNTPHWIIGRFLPTADLGLFSRANSLMNYPAGLFYAVVDRVIFPAVSLIQNQTERLREGALDAVRITAVIGIPITVALFFLGGDVIRVVLGPNWEGAVAPFQILCVATYFKLATRLNWIILRGIGKAYGLAAIQVALFAAMIAACLGGARWGLNGVAAAVTVVICASYLSTGALAMRAAGIPLAAWLRGHGHGLACGVLAAVVLGPLVVVLDAFEVPSIVVLAAGGALGLGAGSLAAWLAPGVFLGDAASGVLRSAIGLLRRRISGISG